VSAAVQAVPSPAEVALIRRAQRGDGDAFGRLVRAHEALAHRVAAFIAGPRHAEDVTQLAFINAFRALERFQVGRPFEPWLVQIVVNQARTALRQEGRQVDLATRASALLAPRHGSADEADVRALRAEARTALDGALARLPAKHREVVACRYLLDLSEEETATVLGLRPGTVKSRLSRGLARLRRELEDAAPKAA
jgi:RNA polymerase sigma factor (sigma-70 family)